MSDDIQFRHAYFVADMNQIQERLTAELKRLEQSSSLVAIVFANARKPFAINSIHPLVPYWNYRSRDYVSFFFPGYVGDDSVGESEYVPVLDPGGHFSDKTFTETIEDFEQQTDWKYNGDTPVVICRAVLRYHNRTHEARAFLDFESIIEFELERALRAHAIESIEAVFEALIRAAKETRGEGVQWQLRALAKIN